MGELGLAGLIVPEKYEGTAAGAVVYAMAVEEISRNCASLGVTLSAHTSLCTWPILHLANEEQKQSGCPVWPPEKHWVHWA
jgi:alkylation response protein AidB-like acyl-CoA dehydrogenase